MSVKQKLVLLFLLTVGLSQLTFDLLDMPVLKAIGSATGASPAPKVFTAQKGFETYSSRFFIEWNDKAGQEHALQLTPNVYRGIEGPYNRRNAYGAVISYGPVLLSNPRTKSMFETAARYTLCGSSTILNELGINRDDISGTIRVRLEPRQKLPEGHTWQLQYEINCYE